MSPGFSVDNFAAGYVCVYIYIFLCIALLSLVFAWDTVNSLSLCTYWQLIT